MTTKQKLERAIKALENIVETVNNKHLYKYDWATLETIKYFAAGRLKDIKNKGK